MLKYTQTEAQKRVAKRRRTWNSMAGLHTKVAREGRELLVLLQNMPGTSRWQALAIESADDAEGPEAVLADHAHHVVTERPVNLLRAMEATELYIEKWLDGHAEVEDCGCEPIALLEPLEPLKPAP